MDEDGSPVDAMLVCEIIDGHSGQVIRLEVAELSWVEAGLHLTGSALHVGPILTPRKTQVPVLLGPSGVVRVSTDKLHHKLDLSMAEYSDFQKLDIRVGRIVQVDDFPEARKPAYKLRIDFGPEIGVKRSTAQLVKNYQKSELQDKLVLGVINFPARQIGPAVSEVLTLGVPDADGECVLITPDKDAPLGGRLY